MLQFWFKVIYNKVEKHERSTDLLFVPTVPKYRVNVLYIYI